MRIGRVLGTFGVRGYLKCAYTTDSPEKIPARTDYFLVDPRSSETIQVKNEKAELRPNNFVIKFEGFTAPEPIRIYKGWDVCYASDKAELEREEDEVFLFELEGLEVRTANRVLGTVTSVMDTGAHAILELECDGKTIMIPFTKQHVPELNLEEGWLITTYPLDQYGIEP